MRTWPSLGANEAKELMGAGGGRRDGHHSCCFGVTLGCRVGHARGVPNFGIHGGPSHPPTSSCPARAPQDTAIPMWHLALSVPTCVPPFQERPVALGLEERGGGDDIFFFFFTVNFFFFLKPKPPPRAFRQVPTATIWSIKINLACLAAPVRGGRGGGGGGERGKEGGGPGPGPGEESSQLL